MNVKKFFRRLKFLFFRPELDVQPDAQLRDSSNSALPNGMRLSNKSNHLVMRHISVLFELEYKSLGDEFYLFASNLWAYLAAWNGDSFCISKLLGFMREQPGEALTVPLDLINGAVNAINVPGVLLEELCLLPAHCNIELSYDLLPLLGGRLYVLRAYPAGSTGIFEESCYQEHLLYRSLRPIPYCYRNYSPHSLRSGKRLGIGEIISMFLEACRIRQADEHYTIDL